MLNYSETNAASIPLAFLKLKRFTKEYNETISHLSFTYDVSKTSCAVEGVFSQETEKSELSVDILDSIEYLYKNIINEYSMVFKKLFLKSIHIESDIDLIGVVFSSLKVTCRFSLNVPNFAMDTKTLIGSILGQAVIGEKNCFLERPVTEFSIFFKKRKARSLNLVTDYSIEDEELLASRVRSGYMLTLNSFIDMYSTNKNIVLPDCNLSFSLLNRRSLEITSGSIYSTVNIEKDTYGLAQTSLKRSLEELDFFTSNIDGFKPYLLSVKQHSRSRYKLILSFKNEHDNHNPFQVTSVTFLEQYNVLITAIVRMFENKSLNLNWHQYLDIKLKPSNTSFFSNWEIANYRLSQNVEETNNTNLNSKMKELRNSISSRYKIGRITVFKDKQSINKIDAFLERLGSDSISSDLAINLPQLNGNFEDSLEYECALDNDSFFVYELKGRFEVK